MFRKNLIWIVGVLVIGLFMGFDSMFGKDTRKVVNDAVPRIVEPIGDASPSYSPNQIGTESATAVLAALMWNAYSPQGAYTNLISYDPYSGAITIVHRGDRQNNPGSGYLWYTVSIDTGANWLDVGHFNTDSITTARHPNIMISNPTQSSDPFDPDIKPVMFSNSLWPGIWLGLLAATDVQLLGGFPLVQHEFLDPDGHFVEAMASIDNNGAVFAPVEDFGATFELQNLLLYWSTDQGTNWSNTVVAPASWFANFNGPMVDFAPDGMTGVVAWDAVPANDPNGEYQFGFVKTTDGGTTWSSSPTWIPQSSISGLPSGIGGLNYEVDMIVDMNGDPHFVGTYVDTATGANTGVYEVYWDGTGWSANLISLVNATVFPLPGNLQALNEPELSRNLAGDVIYVKYIDLPDTNSTKADVFVSARFLNGSWSSPMNVTMTPDVHEKFSNLADRVGDEGNGAGRMHIYYTIFGNGDSDDLAESEIWYLKDVIATPGPLGIEEPSSTISTFVLRQNYPNPFNPSTTIEYSLKRPASVTLEVFNVTGQKVATLVDGRQKAGEHKVVFDAADLASGVYFYKLTADKVSRTRKMMLLK